MQTDAQLFRESLLSGGGGGGGCKYDGQEPIGPENKPPEFEAGNTGKYRSKPALKRPSITKTYTFETY